MGSNSTQGLAVLVFLVAFAFLSMGLAGGSMLDYVVFVVGLAGSVMLFLKAKPMEHAG